MDSPSRRMQRVNDQIRDEIADLLMHETDDPHLRGLISVTGVETAPDLSRAKVFVSVLGTDDEADDTLAHMKRATSFFRRELAARLNLRHTPELEFRLDKSIAEGAKINSLLKEIDD
jgi:ribosome-binding factor A